ncbi:hypothetical protein FSOLCH5_003730 [Fusarium solani]
MPPIKRPYRAKVKGCHECSQRRVNCDRGTPECRKCIAKGLKCSGLGVRHRFSNGVASRGHYSGKTMDTAYPLMKRQVKSNVAKTITQPEQPRNDSSGEQRVAAISQETTPRRLIHGDINTNIAPSGAVDTLQVPDEALEAYSEQPISWELLLETHHIFSLVDIGNQQDADDDRPKAAEIDLFCENNVLMIPPSNPDHVPAWKRRLLLNYSDNIASEMIAIDGPHNGWRYLMLPMAESDELVMDAVLAISLFHSSGILHKDLVVDKAEQDHYGRAIQGLQKRSQLRYCDRSDQQSVLITVLLLLTAVMVNGSSDFPILFGMLQSAIDAIGGEGELGSGEIAEFLVRQVHK